MQKPKQSSHSIPSGSQHEQSTSQRKPKTRQDSVVSDSSPKKAQKKQVSASPAQSKAIDKQIVHVLSREAEKMGSNIQFSYSISSNEVFLSMNSGSVQPTQRACQRSRGKAKPKVPQKAQPKTQPKAQQKVQPEVKSKSKAKPAPRQEKKSEKKSEKKITIVKKQRQQPSRE